METLFPLVCQSLLLFSYAVSLRIPWEVGYQELIEAAVFFDPHGSKKNTLFDAVIATIAKHVEADAIFSFDQWYRKQGLTSSLPAIVYCAAPTINCMS